MNTIRIAVVAVAIVSLAAGYAPSMLADDARIPGAGGGSSNQEKIIEGTLEKYDLTLNKITIRGIGEDRMTMDAVRSLKAKDGTKRVPMATVKPGQKIRVYYVEKGDKKLAKDVEVVHKSPDEESTSPGPKKDKESSEELPKIPGA